MRMVDVWGYRLAKTPTLKSRRPAFRAARNSSIINDISYFATVEVSGIRGDIVAVLKRSLGTSPWAGGKYESGARMARTTIHHQSQWPRGLIGPVDLLWRGQSPSAVERTNECRVWLRFHPAMFEEAWKALTDSLVGVRSLMTESNAVPSVKISDLRGEINCFEIMGPKAGLVLQGITSVCKSESKSKHKF